MASKPDGEGAGPGSGSLDQKPRRFQSSGIERFMKEKPAGMAGLSKVQC
jgi:hypothetical protein